MASWDDVVAICDAELPLVERSTSYGTPALKVKGKLFARLREEGEHVALFVDFVEREALVEEDPAVYEVTDHYREYPMMLMRLSQASADQLREALVESWCQRAPKRVLAEYEAGES